MNTSTQLQIRDALPEERDAIRDMTIAAYAQYAPLMPHWVMYRRLVLSILDEDETPERIVAIRSGTIVGSVLLYPASANVYETESVNNGAPEMRLLAVAPHARGLGVGAALLNECVRRARATGAAELGLHTEDIMEVAVRMYRRKGFVHVPALDFSPSVGVIVKGYRLTLGPAEEAVPT